MYKVMIISPDSEMANELEAMKLWGETSGFEISKVTDNGDSAYRELCREKYDLIICDTHINGMGSLELLRRIEEEKLGGRLAFCSKYADFEYARQGIILNAFDYFISPFYEEQFLAAFNRIQNKANDNIAIKTDYAGKIIELFETRDAGIYAYLSDVLNEIYENSHNMASAENALSKIYKTVITEIFERYEWLDLYKSVQSFYERTELFGYITYDKLFKTRITELFEEFCELFPKVDNRQIKTVMLYILNNPESDLKQKTIASALNINSTYLSTIFSVQTKLRFIDYLTAVKLKRAGWLLQNTSMKVTEIAARLDYKDIGYFSRVFKKQYGVTPTEYRIPDDYTYQI